MPGAKMRIELDLDKNFAKKIKELSEKYGENFEFINGLSNSRLNFTDYIAKSERRRRSA